MSTSAYKAHLAARSPTSGQKKTSHHHRDPLPQPKEEHVSSTYHPHVLARPHAHQFIQSHGGDSGTSAPYAAMDPHVSRGQKKTSHHHRDPLPQPMEEHVSPTYHPHVLARPHAHQFIQSHGGGSGTTAPYAAVDPHVSSGQKKTSHHHRDHLPQPMEEHVSPTYHPYVLARPHAHQFIQSHGGDSGTTAPYAAVDPHVSNQFVGQGAYQARIYERYGPY